ncbi:MAG TPA: hypothetical protein VK502_02525 [Candidatus Saccharimonadales bacterium]|nr:hypothetical protein [Candidatus Saccharimonadales bacterium]
MSGTKPIKTGGHLAAIIATVISITLAALLFFNRQCVVDQLTVWQYKPSGEVATLADRSGMNDKGKFFFYASQPAVENAQSFNKQCGRLEASTAILGCYNGRNIYVYNVTDARLDGIREVTAAHEMLHAAYARMNDKDKKQVNALLETEYAKLKDDKQFAERMAFYARTEPGERDNELHSVIGTEVANISPELEAHYKTYFTNRGTVVMLHAKYASVFADLQNQSDTLSTELTQLGEKIENESVVYNKEVSQLNQDIQSFNATATGGGFSNQTGFETARTALTSRASQLDAKRQSINNDVARYDTLRQQLTNIASQSDALNHSIDSSLAPAPSL